MEDLKESLGAGGSLPLNPLSPLVTTASPPDALSPVSPDRSSTRADSLSPASSSSSSLTDLVPRLASGPSTSQPPSKETQGDAKTSALKALAGISKVVSKSRQVDAEALQAIKAQRAKVKAEGGTHQPHRHSRTLSSESMHELASNISASSAGSSYTSSSMASNSNQHRSHRRSHSGIPLNTGGNTTTTTPAIPSGTNNNAIHTIAHTAPHIARTTAPSQSLYAEVLSGMSLTDLLALQSAVDNEIQKQLAGTGLTSLTIATATGPNTTPTANTPPGCHSPQSPADLHNTLSAQYTAALLAQQHHASAIALQQALDSVAASLSSAQQQITPSGSNSGSLSHSPLNGPSPRKSRPSLASHHSRSQSIDAIYTYSQQSDSQGHHSPPFTPESGGSAGSLAAAATAVVAPTNFHIPGIDGSFHVNLSGIEDLGALQGPLTARSLDVGAPQPQSTSSIGHSSSDFSFLSDIIVSDPSRSIHHHHNQQSSMERSPMVNNSAEVSQLHSLTPTLNSEQLPVLFGNLHLGGLNDPWR